MEFPRKIQIQSLSCPGCGAPIDLKTGPKSKSFACTGCGSICDTTREPFTILGKMAAASAFPPRSAFRLGLAGRIGLTLYEVLGRVRYEGWDDEERWNWDEWLLQTPVGKFAWLQEDDQGFILFEKTTPHQPVDLNQTVPLEIFIDSNPARVLEVAQSRIVFVEGELTWQPDSGERVKYADAYHPPHFYSVEQSADEIQAFKGLSYAAADLYRAFGLPASQAPDWPAQKNPPAWYGVEDDDDDDDDDDDEGLAGRMVWPSVFFGVIFLLTGFFVSAFGSRVFTETRPFAVASLTEPVVIGPFEMSGDCTYSIGFSSSDIPVNTWLAADLALLDDQKEPLMHLALDFWDEDGYDEGEYWHESDTSYTEYFLPFQGKKTYFIEFQAEAPEAVKAKNPRLTVTVHRGTFVPDSFYVLGGGLLAWALLCAWWSGKIGDDDD